MKKYLYVAMAALIALMSCEKTPADNPDPDPKPGPGQTTDKLELTSAAIVNVAAESSTVEISFTANVAWTAETGNDFIVLNKTNGEAGEAKITAAIQSLPSDLQGRTGTVTLKAGKAGATVTINQGIIFDVTPGEFSVGVDGGKLSFTVVSNTEYSVTIYDDFADWAPAVFNEETGEGYFEVAKNGGYDARTAYVKFTIPAIQDDVYDDETGEPTGETVDHVERLYVYQDGLAAEVWTVSLPDDFDVVGGDTYEATVSIAKFGGQYLVCDGSKVYAVDPATGAFGMAFIPEGLPIQSIANDDAGNLILAPFFPYSSAGKIYAVKATDTAMANPVELIPFVNDAWSGSEGADKVAAKGDVFGNGVVTMMYGGTMENPSYGLVWEIIDGKAAVKDYNEWNKTTEQALGWFQLPEYADNIWLSNRAVFAPKGASVSDGFFYSGYDGIYDVYYYNGTEWTTMIPEQGDWANAPNGMGSTVWNGHEILAVVSMAYFSVWGMPSRLVIYDITAGEILATREYVNDAEEYVSGATETSTTDVILEVEGGDLTATVVDSSWGILFKYKFPAK